MSQNAINQKSSWPIIKSHVADHNFVQEQIDSCDKFFSETIKRIMSNIPPVVVRDKNKRCVRTYTYGKCMLKPMKLPGFADIEKGRDVTPQLCRLRDLSYTCTLVVNSHTHIKYDTGKEEYLKAEKVEIGDIPIMVKSANCILNGLDADDLISKGECPNDQGGYFILSGKERAIVAQERLSYNQLFVFPDKNGLKAEIRCHCEDTDQQSTIHLKYTVSKKQGPIIKVVIPHIHESKGVFLFAVFMALGIPNKKAIMRMIMYPNDNDLEMKERLDGSLSECENIDTREKAISYLCQYVKPRTNLVTSNTPTTADAKKVWLKAWLIYVLDRELFPHLHPTQKTQDRFNALNASNVYTPMFQEYTLSAGYRKRCLEKAWFLAYAVNRLIRVSLKRDLPSDRDHMAHKRLNLSGPLLAQLFKKKIHTQHNTMVKLLMKHVNQNKEVTIGGVMKQVDVTKGLAFSLKTGNWSGTKTNPTNSSKNQGVSQVLNRMNYVSGTSHLRRTSASDTNLSVVRQLHNTQYSICCLTGDTLIRLADNTQTSIKNIYDSGCANVLTVNPVTLENEPSRIMNPFEKMSEQILKISTDDGKNISCTPDHPFLIERDCKYEWVLARDLKCDDMVVTIPDKYDECCEFDQKRCLTNGKVLSKIDSIKQLPGELVYDFTTLSNNHSFISNGFVTHNCPSETPEGHSCLTLDTLIATPKGNVQIGTLSDGDKVLSVHPKYHSQTVTEIHSYFQKEDHVYCLTLENGTTINATADHHFLTRRGWIRVDALVFDLDEFFVTDNQVTNIVRVISKKYIGKRVVADFTTVSDNHSFIANGIVTHNCGLVKNLSLLCHITTGSKTHLVYEWLSDNVNYINVYDLSVDPSQAVVYGWKIFVNGKWLGISPEANIEERSFDDNGKPNPVPEWVHKFREARSRGAKIDVQVSISTYSSDRKEIYIFTDEGRFCRPLFVVDRKTGKLLLTQEIVKKVEHHLDTTLPPGNEWSWQDLIENHIIEYIDVAESESPKIATTFKEVQKGHIPPALPYTHCEIHPSMLLGLLASLISFPDHSQAPRNTYQCLWEEELVLMGDGTRKKIRDVKVDDIVVSFDPLTMITKNTKVVHAHTIPTDKNIVQVTTISDRTIIVTDDHLIMTDKGWMKAKDLDDSVSIAISLEQDSLPFTDSDDVVLSEQQFKSLLTKTGVKTSLIKKYSLDLTKKEILPLRKNSKYLPILARMYGFILTDGSICLYKGEVRLQADFGSRESAQAFEFDVETLGYSKSKISAIHNTYVIRHQTAFCSLFVALGYKPGKTSTQNYPDVQEWIKSSKLTKREFLAGVQGGDGCQIRWNKMEKRGFNYVCGDTLLTVRDEYVASLRQFMKSMSELYQDLGIESKCVEYPSKYKGSTQCGVRIRCTQSNLIKYYKRIGYRYDTRKIVNSGKVIEYLLYKKKLMKTHEKPDAWKLLHRSNIIFVPVSTVEARPNVVISDITTESENHSFIAGDNICVHNSAMGKQAIGIATLNFPKRYDTTNYVLYYPQKPLVCTKMHDIAGTNKMPAGQTTIVAVMEHTGYNQEDSIILSQGWIDRGGGKSTLYKTYKAETKKHKILPDDKFEKPNRDETMGMKKGNYDKLGLDGIVDIGSRINKGDIIIGITGPSPTFSSFSRTRSYNKANTKRVATNINPKLTKKDRSIGIRMEGIADSVLMTQNAEQTTMTKVRIRTIRTPKIGDKFASSVGQKGTVGLILKNQNMPYTERDGIVPDIIMNPHAFPSRMTVNQQIEMLFGKQCAIDMMQGDSTPFQDCDEDNIVDTISDKLRKGGFQSKGEEVMIDGTTGRKIKAKIFIGPAYYQRLKHMVDDKKHSRSKGPHNQLTRQPVEGRMRDGGLRVGEMEKDTLVAHGAAKNLQELMMKKSDQFTVPYCELCGLMAEAKTNRKVYYCRHCDNMDHVYSVKAPYAKKLLFQELMGMLIVPRVELGSSYQ